jgi:hypothetical protein
MPACDYSKKQRGDGAGRPLVNNTSRSSNASKYAGGFEDSAAGTSGASIFDPVLCEIVYRWFSPYKGAKIIDPFAGGSVRGIVASVLGYDYAGVDLREEQIQANSHQAKDICKNNYPIWYIGNSLNIKSICPGEYDLIFSCPPYYDLEIYSDNPEDISALPNYDEFLEIYSRIILNSVSMLKENRFACFVVGDIRDKHGIYRGFVQDTISAFQTSGMKFYNDAVLVTAIGSLPVRIGKQFGDYRKLGKCHQNVLVFYKGDVKAIKNEFEKIDASEEPVRIND